MRLVFLTLLSVTLLLSAADNVGSAQLPKRDVIDTPLRYHSTAQVMAKRLEEQSGRNVTALHLNRRKHHSHRHHVHHSPKSQANGDNKHRGQASYYGGGPQACSEHSSSKYIAALSTEMYEGGKHCGRTVRITNQGQSKSVDVTIRDECPSCDMYKLDLSPDAFRQLAPLEKGIVSIDWYFLD